MRDSWRHFVAEFIGESSLLPVQRDGEFVGLAGVDRSLDALGKAVDGIRVLDSGYAPGSTFKVVTAAAAGCWGRR